MYFTHIICYHTCMSVGGKDSPKAEAEPEDDELPVLVDEAREDGHGRPPDEAASQHHLAVVPAQHTQHHRSR